MKHHFIEATDAITGKPCAISFDDVVYIRDTSDWDCYSKDGNTQIWLQGISEIVEIKETFKQVMDTLNM